MKLPEKDHYSLNELAERWRTAMADVHYYAVHGMLEVETWRRVPAVRIKRYANSALAADFEGYAAVEPAELRRIFRGEETDIRVTEDDLVVSREERDRFERAHKIECIQQTAGNGGGAEPTAAPVSFPGRPSVMRRITTHFDQRRRDKALEKSLQREGDYLAAWAALHISESQLPTARTIRNAIRAQYKDAVAV